MIPAVDFFMYCSGVALCLVSTGFTVKLVFSASNKKDDALMTPTRREPVQVPAPDDLGDRLQQFQATRFASPIVRRTLDADAGPLPRPPPLMPPRPLIRRRADVKLQGLPPRKSDQGKVVQLPVKLNTETPPKKEE